jgi:putative DNA primase/helicase
MSAPRYEFEAIPDYLRERDQWVCWKYETRDGKPTKVPYQWDGGAASSTDPATWASFGLVVLAATDAARGFDGIGYMAAPDEHLVMFDFDHVIDAETGALNPLAAAMVKTLDSYTERTPSGTGLHVYAFGAKPGTRSRATVAKGTAEEFGFEVYDHARYLTLTGWHWDGTPATVETREAEIAEVYRRVFAEPEKAEKTTTRRKLTGAHAWADEQVLAACRAAKNAAKFTALYGGDTTGYPGESEADYALIGMLRFYTQDAEQIERLMRGSKLARDKWDDRRGDGTYLSYSIENALAGDFEVYRGPAAASPAQATGELVRWRGGRELDTTPISYLVDGMIPNGMLGALGGKDGRGKTLLGLEIARCVLTGDKLFGQFAVKQGKVFAMLLDDPEFLVSDRLKAMGILDHPNLKIATQADVDMTNPPAMLAYMAEQLSTEEPTLVLIDALYVFVPEGKNDQANNSGSMLPIMVAFDAICNRTKATVAVVCHDNKAGADIAGSRVVRQMLKWIVRLILPKEFEDDPEGGVETPDRVLQLNKLKTGKPTSWHLRLDGPGTWDYQGTGKEYRAAALEAMVLDYLREAGPKTAHEVAKGIKKRPVAVIEACKTLVATGRARTQYQPKTRGGSDAIVYAPGG